MSWTYELADLYAADAAPIKLIRYSPNGELMAAVDVRRTVRVWRGSEIVYERRFRASWDRLRGIDHVRDLAFDCEGRRILVASGNRVRAFDLSSGREMQVGQRKPSLGFMITCPQSVAISPANEVSIAYDDAVIEVLTLLETACRPKSTWQDNDAPGELYYSFDGTKIVGTDRYSVCVWDPVLGTKLGRLMAEKVYGMAVSPVDDLIAVRNLRGIALWNIESGELIARMPTMAGLPTVVFSRDGKFIAAGDTKGVTLYDRNGILVQRIESIVPVLSLCFSPVEDRLAVGFSDGKLLFWEYVRGMGIGEGDRR
jgi:WD40 repeat protein